MKNLFLSVVLASSPAVLFAADTPSLNGTWQIHNNVSGNESDRPCTFVQTGTDLTGTCSSAQGEAKLTGKIEDKKVTWTFKSQYDGSPITLKYEGTLESPTKIVGSVDVPEYGASGDFTATLSK